MCACACASVRDALVMTVRFLHILGVCVCWERERECLRACTCVLVRDALMMTARVLYIIGVRVRERECVCACV